MSKVTLEQLQTALAQVVAEYGPTTTYAQRYADLTDGKYPVESACHYQVAGEPGCLIGVALDRLGVTLDPAWDLDSGTNAIGLDVWDNPDTGRYADRVQARQDLGKTWGEAISGRAPVIEPTGLGAVVEVSNSDDNWGPYWFVRTVQGRWQRSDGISSEPWSALASNDTIKVLSEGVQQVVRHSVQLRRPPGGSGI